jgi:anti-sigma regulatory factor (Ser/Thr protein kinase)
LLSELVANSVVHSGLSPRDPVAVSFRPLDDGVRVEVTDGGVGMGHPTVRDRCSGLGLLDRIADRWGHSDHPTRVWFEVTA